jgi:hypothetical protein
MTKNLGIIANIIAVLGVLLCFVAGVARLAGNYHVLGYEAMTLFQAGTGLMVFACLAKLQQLVSR